MQQIFWCHFCRSENKDELAEYLSNTRWGWQYVCKKHFINCGTGLGEGKGKHLPEIKVEYEKRKLEEVTPQIRGSFGHINRKRK